jgi:hypothetical protein
VGSDPELKLQLIAIVYDSSVGGHSGVPVTYRRMKQLFAWKGTRTSVQDYVQSCMICQQAKPNRAKSLGLLQTISMDFVEGLPQSSHATCIMVVIDKFTKYGHFLPLKHPYTSVSVAKLFLDEVYRLHGMPLSIISDRDKIFTSKFWRELFSLAQAQLSMSSVYHHSLDGQTKRVN